VHPQFRILEIFGFENKAMENFLRQFDEKLLETEHWFKRFKSLWIHIM
jgi:hypothetical protein